MTHQRRADTLALVLVDHRESDLCFPGLLNDIASAADNHGPAAFVNHRHQGNVADKVNVQEERDFLLGEMTFQTEETAIERPGAAAADSGHKIGLVIRLEGTDLDRAPIAHSLKFRI